MNIRYFFPILSMFFFFTAQAQKENIVIDKIICKVGNEVILLSELEEQYSYMKSQMNTNPDKCEILVDIISQKLLTNQAKLDSLPVTEQQVEEQLSVRIDRILQMMNNDLSQFENYYGKSVAEVRSEMRSSIRDQIFSDLMRSKIISDIEATPSETIAFFNKLPKDSIPYYNAEVQLNELVFNPVISEKEKKKAIERLRSIKDRITDGEISFEEAAKLYSEDYGTAQRGGDLGMMKRGSLVQEYEATAYNLEQGEISDIVESEFGYHLIKLIERRGNNIHTQHILIKPELTADDLARSIKQLDSIKQLIVTDSMSFAQAVRYFGDENVQSYNNGGGMLNQATGDSFFEIGELDPDIYFAIDTIEAGEIAGPIQFTERDGTVVLRLIQLKSITEPHRASLVTDYAKIKNLADRVKQYNAFQSWIDKTIQQTYLAVFPPYNECDSVQRWTRKASSMSLSE